MQELCGSGERIRKRNNQSLRKMAFDSRNIHEPYPSGTLPLSLALTEERSEFFDAITKIQKMTWQQIWDTSTKTPGQKRGFNFEKIEGQVTPSGEQVCSIRITQKFRARVCRQDRWMRYISLHPDHDSAYKA